MENGEGEGERERERKGEKERVSECHGCVSAVCDHKQLSTAGPCGTFKWLKRLQVRPTVIFCLSHFHRGAGTTGPKS